MAPREAHELIVKSSTKPDEDGEIMSRVLETTWQDLQRDINAAFAESSAVSPDHPCARMVCGADWQRLRDELHGHGRWVDGHYTRTSRTSEHARSTRHTRRNSSLCGMYPLKANAAFCRRLIEPVTLPPLGRVRREEGPPLPRTLGGA